MQFENAKWGLKRLAVTQSQWSLIAAAAAAAIYPMCNRQKIRGNSKRGEGERRLTILVVLLQRPTAVSAVAKNRKK